MPIDSESPLVTVIMPVRNEEVFIRWSLGAVLGQDYPPDRLEVLVVDGDSTDRTAAIVQAMAQTDARVRLLHNPARMQARALNLALDVARGDVIVRVDGHTIITPDYVSRCVTHLRQTGADNVGGPQRAVGMTLWGRAVAAAHRSSFGIPSRFRVGSHAGYVDTVYMGAWPRDVFDRVGRFDESVGVHEDYEFNYRIRRAGGRVYLTPDIRSTYYGRQTPAGLWRQFFRYGEAKAIMLRRFPASVRLRHLAAPGFVLAVATGIILAPFFRMIRRFWQLALLSYSAANAAASLRTAARDGWDVLTRLPLVFVCMHIAWGCGFWFSVCRMIGASIHERGS